MSTRKIIGKEIVTFGNIEVEKYKFHQNKSLFSIYHVDLVVSNIFLVKKEFKYLTGCEDGKKLDLYVQ